MANLATGPKAIEEDNILEAEGSARISVRLKPALAVVVLISQLAGYRG